MAQLLLRITLLRQINQIMLKNYRMYNTKNCHDMNV